MATCKDCMHCEACTDLLESMGYTVDGDGLNADKLCDKFKPQPPQGVAIALTPEEWETVLHWLDYGASYNNAKKWEWRANCKDKRMAAEIVAEHEAAEAKARNLHKIIEGVLHPAPPETE